MAPSPTRPAFSLVEAVISCAVLALLVTAFTGGFTVFNRTQNQAVSRYRAVLVSEEGLEAVRSIRDAQFSQLVDGTHGLVQTGNVWTFSGSSDTVNGFRRVITVSPVDATTKNVLSTVTWSAGGRTQTYNIATRLTNWRLPTQTATTTTLAAAPNPSTYGATVTLTATIAPLTATGTVTFKDGTNTLGSVAAVNGIATLTVSSLAVGTHPLTAEYSGSVSYLPSTSLVVNQVVNQNGAAVVLVSNPNPSAPNQNVILSATVNPNTTTGTITFKDGTTIIGTGIITGGAATMTTSTLAVGSHSLTAVYSGDINNSPATSSAITHVVQKIITTTTLTSDINPSNQSQQITLTATVAPAAATGTVTFIDGATTIGTGVMTAGVATMTTSSLAVGSHSLTAVYPGDSTYLSSTSSVLTQVVQGWSTPQIKSSFNSCSAGSNWRVAVANNYAYIGVKVPGPQLCTINLTPLTAPTNVAANSLSASPTDLVVNGGWLYVATDRNNGELQTLSLSNPANPGTNNLGDAPGNADATGIAVLGTSAYITRLTSSDTEFERYNISNPAAPSRTAGLQIAANLNDVAIAGSYAYVASDNGSAELYIINLTNPAVPTLSGSVNMTGTSSALTVAAVGSMLLVGQANGTLSVYSLSTPTAPVLLGSVSAGGSVNDIALKTDGSLAFLATSNATAEFRVISLATPATPSILSSVNLPTAARGVAYDNTGNYVVAVGDPGGNQVTVISP